LRSSGLYVAILSGVLAAWLVQHFPGLHLDQDTLAATISEAVVFAVGAIVTYALHHKWLDGWQKWEGSLAKLVDAEVPDLTPIGAYDPTAFDDAQMGQMGDGLAQGFSDPFGIPETAVRPDAPTGELEPTEFR
jgi:hypothetical protein